MKHPFHITTLLKLYIARVKVKHKEAVLVYNCYVEVVFNFVAQVPSQSCSCAFSVLIWLYRSHILFIFKNVLFQCIYTCITHVVRA